MIFPGLFEWILRCLGAEILAAAMLYSGYGLARQLVRTGGLALRWTATAIATMWIASAAFWCLLPLGAFRPLPALAAIGVVCALVHALARPSGGVVAPALDDVRATFSALLDGPHPGWPRVVSRIGLALGAVVAMRALLVPVVAWDSLTYHAVKAGMWVQSGGPIGFDAPGGWSIYRHYLGGGEVLHAWAMLALHGDLLVGAIDAAQWALVGAATYALAREIELSAAMGWVAAGYVMAIPAVARAVGSLYVDNTLALALIAATVFAIHAVRHAAPRAACACVLAAGLACGVKVFALPIAALLGAGVVVGLWIRGRPQRTWAWLAAGVAGAAATSLPWFVSTWRQTGFALSPLPLEIAGRTLGRANEAMQWYLDRPALIGAGPAEELRALGTMFGVPGLVPLSTPTLGAFTLVPLLLFLAGLPGGVRRNPRTWLFGAIAVLPALGSLYTSGMKITRLQWAGVTGRYVIAAVAVAVVFSLAVPDRGSRWQRIHAALLLVTLAAYVPLSDLAGWRWVEFATAAGLALGAGLALAAGVRVARRAAPAIGITLAIVLPLAFAILLGAHRERTRADWLTSTIVLHAVPRYWIPAALALDDPAHARTVAVAAGPAQDADNWLLYPFLGRRLQNRLVYVPVTRDGSIVEPARRRERVAAGDFDVWVGRLRAAEVSEVMCFAPTSLELFWMERRPDAFSRIVGDGRRWGLYRLTPGS